MAERLDENKRPRKREERVLPKIEDTEFGKEKLVSQAIQRSYNQSGVVDEPLTEDDE